MKTLKKCSWNNDIWLIYDYSIPFSTDVQKVIINSLLAKPFTSTINSERHYLPGPPPPPRQNPNSSQPSTKAAWTHHGFQIQLRYTLRGVALAGGFFRRSPTCGNIKTGASDSDPHPTSVCWMKHWKKNMGFELIMHLPFAVKSEVKSKAIYLECFCWFQNSSALFQGKFQWELRSVLWFLCSTVYST